MTVLARPIERLGAYLALTKPRIIELLLITTVPAMILAAGEWPGTWLVVATVVGGTLSAGGANAINNVVDRDIDARMRRTAHRPVPAERLSARQALTAGIVLGIAGFVWLWVTTNLLAGLIATAALVFYVVVYTMWLKRTTVQNIVIGGAAGSAPALVGWAAVTGSVDLPAWVMFAIVFTWTPPHFWALSLRFRDDYAAAEVPMLPVVAGERSTVLHIVLYAVMLFGVSLLLHPVSDLGAPYLVTAIVLGVCFVGASARLFVDRGFAMRVFHLSNVYLTLLFAAVAFDVLA